MKTKGYTAVVDPEEEPCPTCGHSPYADISYDGEVVSWVDFYGCTNLMRFNGPPDEFFEWFQETYPAPFDKDRAELMIEFREWLYE